MSGEAKPYAVRCWFVVSELDPAPALNFPSTVNEGEGYSSTYAKAWLRRRRATPSHGTGPDFDHTFGAQETGGGNGYYMYFEVRGGGGDYHSNLCIAS